MWLVSRDWPAKHLADLREDFVGSFRQSIEAAFEEMLYFLAFATDLRYPPHSKGTAEI
jgi:hypothetical protein